MTTNVLSQLTRRPGGGLLNSKEFKGNRRQPGFETSSGFSKIITNKNNYKFGVVIGKSVSQGRQCSLHKKVPIPNPKGGGESKLFILRLMPVPRKQALTISK